MTVYSSNEIVDIILVLDKVGRNYCIVERLYCNKYLRLDDSQMQCR